MRPQQFVTFLQSGAKHRLRFIKLTAHAGILRALAGEEKRELRSAGGCFLTHAGEDTRRGLTCRKRREFFPQLLR